ncbi:MAG: hypothetical protein IIZ12_06470 [Eggerthellaceae bacterium]|nr:hypothetical protein [Eggerthellaceae bacterium]
MTLTFRPLKADEVECRVAQCSDKGCSLLLYKDARCDMRLLDETVGPERWQKRYECIDGKLFCSIGIEFDGEWIWKQDVGTPSNMEADKGHASDAFKRAGFNWGIGRELYTAPFIWVPADKCKKLFKNQKSGRWQCYDDFRVTEMDVDDGQIVNLQICNASNRMAVVYGPQKRSEAHDNDDAGKDTAEAKRRLWAAICKLSELNGGDPKEMLAGLQATDGWKDTAEYYNAKAEMLEGECNGAV